jgi:hypothetical protein
LRRSPDPLELANSAVVAWREDDEEWYTYEHLLNFFEDLGTLEKGKAVQLWLIRESLGSVVVRGWNQWGAAVQSLRDAAHQDTLYENFQLLHDRLIGRRLSFSQRIRRKLGMRY